MVFKIDGVFYQSFCWTEHSSIFKTKSFGFTYATSRIISSITCPSLYWMLAFCCNFSYRRMQVSIFGITVFSKARNYSKLFWQCIVYFKTGNIIIGNNRIINVFRHFRYQWLFNSTKKNVRLIYRFNNFLLIVLPRLMDFMSLKIFSALKFAQFII